jgi:hypothetical protein
MSITAWLTARREAAGREWLQARGTNVARIRHARRRLTLWDWLLDAWTLRGTR